MEYHYDSLLDEDPEIKEKIAQGKLQGAQTIVVTFLEARFPSLAELGQRSNTSIAFSSLFGISPNIDNSSVCWYP